MEASLKSIESTLKGWEGKPVYIKWRDCSEVHGWSTKAEADSFSRDDMNVDTCGFFYRIEDDRVMVSLSRGFPEEGGEPTVFGSLISIPRSAVVSVKRLK